MTKTNKFKNFQTFREYLQQFELSVMAKLFELSMQKGIVKRKYKVVNSQIVPLRGNGKLQDFQNHIGRTFLYQKPLAFDFYGCYKVSRHIVEKVESLKSLFPHIRVVKTPVIFFSSIQPEIVKDLFPEGVHDFLDFKEEVVLQRWGKDEEALLEME